MWQGAMKRRESIETFYIFFHRASRGAAWTVHFKFASYAYDELANLWQDVTLLFAY